jgi:hypothetical protein
MVPDRTPENLDHILLGAGTLIPVGTREGNHDRERPVSATRPGLGRQSLVEHIFHQHDTNVLTLAKIRYPSYSL